MKSLVITLFICVFSIQIGVSQSSLNDYHYVVVPDQFEFLKGKDQFQVNTLTTWLLNKNGFNAYLDSQLPLSLRKLPCKGLKAVIITKENFIMLKANVVFTDCMGNVVYTSDEGRSKEKDYRKSYHEAVRQAFESITALNVTQLPLDNIEEDTNDIFVSEVRKEVKEIAPLVTPAVIKDLVVSPEEELETLSKTVSLPSTATSTDFGEPLYFKDYTLKANQKNFDILYNGALIGTAKLNPNSVVYLVSTSQFTGVGYPKADGFVIERKIEGMDQTIKMTFTKK